MSNDPIIAEIRKYFEEKYGRCVLSDVQIRSHLDAMTANIATEQRKQEDMTDFEVWSRRYAGYTWIS